MNNQKAFVSIIEMFNYLKCDSGARCVSKRQKVKSNNDERRNDIKYSKHFSCYDPIVKIQF